MRQNTSKKVLILEDEPDAGLLMAGILRSFGYTAVLVTTLAEARKVLTKEESLGRIDLLFFDYNLPDGKSIELIKDKKINTDIPTIICSAYLSAANEQEMRIYGVTDCLSKPINTKEIKSMLEKHDLI